MQYEIATIREMLAKGNYAPFGEALETDSLEGWVVDYLRKHIPEQIRTAWNSGLSWDTDCSADDVIDRFAIYDGGSSSLSGRINITQISKQPTPLGNAVMLTLDRASFFHPFFWPIPDGEVYQKDVGWIEVSLPRGAYLGDLVIKVQLSWKPQVRL